MSSSDLPLTLFVFFFNATPTTEIYTLSLHDALPISPAFRSWRAWAGDYPTPDPIVRSYPACPLDRKSTRLNSSHSQISYAVFCLKKKNNITNPISDAIVPTDTSAPHILPGVSIPFY